MTAFLPPEEQPVHGHLFQGSVSGEPDSSYGHPANTTGWFATGPARVVQIAVRANLQVSVAVEEGFVDNPAANTPQTIAWTTLPAVTPSESLPEPGVGMSISTITLTATLFRVWFYCLTEVGTPVGQLSIRCIDEGV